MNSKMRKFAAFMRQTKNPIEAALKSGYSKRNIELTVASLLERPDVQEAIGRRAEAGISLGHVTEADVKLALAKIAFSDSKETKDSDRTAALKLLGQSLGMFKPATFHQPAFDANGEKIDRRRKAKTLNSPEHIAAKAAEAEAIAPEAVSPLARLMHGIKH